MGETLMQRRRVSEEVFRYVKLYQQGRGATGSKYSLVPTDNSAGNFVKIQQRIPVRIDFTNLSKEDNERLAAGMMVVVKARL